MIHQKYYELKEKQDLFLNRKNEVDTRFYNGIYDRYVNPVLTRDTLPIEWQYDLNAETNPYFEERLGINAVMNSGALYLNGKYYLVARIEGNDRKSFFGVAESGWLQILGLPGCSAGYLPGGNQCLRHETHQA